MKVETGKGEISLAALWGIWSVSALTSLPGLAVSPILDKISHIFPSSSQIDVQLLTSLPSLMIIPFVLITGHITEKVGYFKTLACGLWVFMISGILYLLCTDMWQLIVVSALLGVGAGIIIPLSTSLISRFFIGDYRTQQFGYSSAITNIMLVLATALTGYLAEVEWKLPFVVYLFPIFSIVLLPFIRRADSGRVIEEHNRVSVSKGIDYGKLIQYMLYYFIVTYLTVIVSFNLPYLMGEYGFDSGTSGLMISLFFLAIMLPGFFLPSILRFMSGKVERSSLLMIMVGLLVIYLFKSLLSIALGCVVMGVGYGIVQPYLYDRVSSVASSQRVTFALALLMSVNYVAILVCPFVIDNVQEFMHVSSQRFAFGFNVVISILSLIAMLIRRVIIYKNH